MDLSKVFDIQNQKPLIAKMETYGLDSESFTLSNRTIPWIGNPFSEWERIIAGVLQGSILGPLLFNIFMNDIFLYIKKINPCNYADDITSTEEIVQGKLHFLCSVVFMTIPWF